MVFGHHLLNFFRGDGAQIALFFGIGVQIEQAVWFAVCGVEFQIALTDRVLCSVRPVQRAVQGLLFAFEERPSVLGINDAVIGHCSIGESGESGPCPFIRAASSATSAWYY